MKALLLIALSALLQCSTSAPQPRHPKSQGADEGPAAASQAAALPEVQLGFNAKGTLHTAQQVQLADDVFARLPKSLLQNLHIRVNGGTKSQKEYPSDWSEAQIASWVKLQQKYGFGLVYVINGNDPPQSQKAFIEHWQEQGARFSFLEMMNEYYLPKFRKGDTSKEEVTRAVDVKAYTEEILPAYIAELKTLNIPLFLICAPKKGGKTDALADEWNKTVAAFISKHQGDGIVYGATVHLYLRDKPFDYGQITSLKSLLPPGTPLAVTEAGDLSRTRSGYSAKAPSVYQHYRSIIEHLSAGDYLFDQVLYNDYEADDMSTLSANGGGLTPKGESVVRLMREIYSN